MIRKGRSLSVLKQGQGGRKKGGLKHQTRDRIREFLRRKKSERPEGYGPSEIAKLFDVGKTAAVTHLQNLVDAGCAERDEKRGLYKWKEFSLEDAPAILRNIAKARTPPEGTPESILVQLTERNLIQKSEKQRYELLHAGFVVAGLCMLCKEELGQGLLAHGNVWMGGILVHPRCLATDLDSFIPDPPGDAEWCALCGLPLTLEAYLHLVASDEVVDEELETGWGGSKQDEEMPARSHGKRSPKDAERVRNARLAFYRLALPIGEAYSYVTSVWAARDAIPSMSFHGEGMSSMVVRADGKLYHPYCFSFIQGDAVLDPAKLREGKGP